MNTQVIFLDRNEVDGKSSLSFSWVLLIVLDLDIQRNLKSKCNRPYDIKYSLVCSVILN